MAIDPAVLAKQRQPATVTRLEYACPRCGTRTTDKSGVCAGCKHGHVPDLKRLKTEAVVGLIAACRAELKRRRDELDAALGEP